MKFFGVIAAGVLALASQAALGNLRVSPMTVSLEPSGAYTSTSVQVTNVTDRPLRIEARTERRFEAEDGTLTSVPEEENFLIFPPQTVLEPGATQAFRIQWLGEPVLDQSQSYYLYIRTVPGTPDGVGVGLSYQFGVSVHVLPPGAEPHVTVAEAVATSFEGKPALGLLFENSGNRLARIRDHEPRISYRGEAGQVIEVTEQQLAEAMGTGFILPASKRRFIIPVPVAPAPASSISAEVSPEPSR